MASVVQYREIEGRSVFVCCAGCIDMLKENPDEYLPNLPG